MLMSKAAGRNLKLVACLPILSGLVSIVNVMQEAFAGKISINLNVLSILVGIGLLRLEPKAHEWGLVFAGFWMVAAASLILLSVGTLIGLDARLPIPTVEGEPALGLLSGTPIFAWAFLTYRVLNHPDVRQLFDK
jgi:hypothetical protein